MDLSLLLDHHYTNLLLATLWLQAKIVLVLD